MKRLAYLLCAVMIGLLLNSEPANAQGKVTEQTIIQTITNDFEETHDLKLDGYHFVHIKDIASERSSSYKSLFNIYVKLTEHQIIGDFTPLYYISEENKKGFVLEKKLDGMNSLYNLEYDNTSQSWKVINQVNEKGTDLFKLGLLKSR